MTHSSTRDLLQKSVQSPKQKGLTHEQLEKSKVANVEQCDDFFRLYIETKDDVVTTARFEGEGCAISVASTDVLLNLIENKNKNEVSNIIDIYKKFLHGEVDSTGYEILDHFKLVQQHKSRRKCASVALETIGKEIN